MQTPISNDKDDGIPPLEHNDDEEMEWNDTLNVKEFMDANQDIEDQPSCELEEHAINGSIQTFVFQIKREEHHDPMKCMANKTDQIESTLRHVMEKKGDIKWYMSLKEKFQREKKGDEAEEIQTYFTSECAIAVKKEDIHRYMQTAFMKMFNDFVDFQRQGNDWKLSIYLSFYTDFPS